MDKIRAVLLHLGSNMWRKKGYQSPAKKDVEDFIYRDEMFCQKEVWTRITSLLPKMGFNTLVIDLGEGVRLDSHPELAVPGSWSKQEMQEELARLRRLGLNPIPKFNFSPGHSAWMGDWAYRIGTPEFDGFCKDLIEETIDLFDTPDFFHIGLEEEDYHSQKNNYIAVVRCPEKKTRDTKYLFDIIMNRGVRPAIWMDLQTLENFGGPENIRDNMPQEVLFFTWNYDIHRDMPTLEQADDYIRLIHQLAALDYDVVPTTSTWCWHLNTKEVMTACKKFVPAERIAGFMTASWMLTRENKFFQLLNDAYTFHTAYRDVFGLENADFKPWELYIEKEGSI
ncbi:MAG: hypothetical protein IJ043_04800 [Clostridia bacterium]|nr:hypothetical protein [Clostridia bacterium]